MADTSRSEVSPLSEDEDGVEKDDKEDGDGSGGEDAPGEEDMAGAAMETGSDSQGYEALEEGAKMDVDEVRVISLSGTVC